MCLGGNSVVCMFCPCNFIVLANISAFLNAYYVIEYIEL